MQDSNTNISIIMTLDATMWSMPKYESFYETYSFAGFSGAPLILFLM